MVKSCEVLCEFYEAEDVAFSSELGAVETCEILRFYIYELGNLLFWEIKIIMMYKVLMEPDYGNALFWDEEGCCIGGYDIIYIGEDGHEITFDLSGISGLKEWFLEWVNKTIYSTNLWTDLQWREWWEKGIEFAKAVNQLLPDNVELNYFSLEYPLWKVKPEDTNDGGLFNYGEPITLLKAGIYDFECYILPWTEYELGLNCKYNGNNPIKVSLQLSYNEIEAIIDMWKWAWDNHWMEWSTSEIVTTKLLKTHFPHLYHKVQSIAHEIFCADYPNSEHIQGFGVYKIFCPDEIVEFAAYSSKDYYLK